MSLVELDLPRPPEGGKWCVVCAHLLVTAVQETYAATMKEYASDGETGIRVIRPRTLPAPLREAVVYGVSAEMEFLGLIDVCWSHLAGFGGKRALLEGGPVPPGLIRGQG